MNNLIEESNVNRLGQGVTRVLSFVHFERNSANANANERFARRKTYGMTFSLFELVVFVINTRVISALRNSRTSNPNIELVIDKDCSAVPST